MKINNTVASKDSLEPKLRGLVDKTKEFDGVIDTALSDTAKK